MATDEKNQFVLYQYLTFFWKKKLWFIIITVATMIVCALAITLLLKHSAYEGNATVNVGSITKTSLTDPTVVQATYQKQIKNGLTVAVGNPGILNLKVTGKNKQSVQDDLNTVTKNLSNDLLSQYNAQYNDTIAYIKDLNQYADSLEKINPTLLQKSTDSNNASILYQTNAASIANARQAAVKSQGDIDTFDKPELLNPTVSHGKSSLKQSVAIGLILGILFSFGILTLWKYIFDAKRAIEK